MDIQTIDQQYQQMQGQSQQLVQQFQVLAGKLQASAQAGNTDAREWLLDLREIAMAFQQQQQQMGALLQAIHGMWQNQAQQFPVQANTGQAVPGQPYPGQPYPGQPFAGGQVPYGAPMPQQTGLMGALDGFLNSGFGRAMEMGAGIGLGEDLINRIF